MSNVYIGEGLLVRFDEKTTPQGSSVYSFSILLPDNPNNRTKKEGTFVPVEAWSEAITPQLAKLLSSKVKDCRVFVKGRLKLDYWDDKTTGAKRTALKVVADVVSYAPLRKSNPNQTGQPQFSNQDQQANTPPQQTATPQPAPQQSVSQQVVQYDAEGNLIPF